MGETLSLKVPAQPFALSLVRLQVGAVAAMLDALLTDVEDLQLATDELCLGLLGGAGADGQLVVDVSWDGRLVEVRCSLDGSTSASPAVEEDPALEGVSDRILTVLVDEHGSTVDGGREVRWLRKRVEPPPR
jgi:hypothetical protein